MRIRYRVLDQRVRELEKVVDRCLTERERHLPAPTAAAIRAQVMRRAEGLLCLLSVDELAGSDPFSVALRSRLADEIESDTMKAISDAVGSMSSWVN